MSAEDRILYTAERNNGDEQLRVTLGEFNGRPTLQVRVFFKSKSGDFLPTKKGTAIRRDELSGVIDALQKAGRELGASQRPRQTTIPSNSYDQRDPTEGLF